MMHIHFYAIISFSSDNGFIRRKISNILGVIGTPLFSSTLALHCSIAFGTAPPPGHVRQVKKWCFGSMTRPPYAASSVMGYASDTASAVVKVEPNLNRISRDWPTLWQPAAPPVMTKVASWRLPVFSAMIHQILDQWFWYLGSLYDNHSSDIFHKNKTFVKMWYEPIFHTCHQTKLNNILAHDCNIL